MPDSSAPPPNAATPPSSIVATTRTSKADDGMRCERCNAEMFRMHAVWRCPACGFKTDCCGW
jgi:DNA-directed RNA polymerase subunit RPC12/RpoP